MTTIDEKDQKILGFIAVKGEVFFKELVDSDIMAKSTLSKHLKELKRNGLVEKIISKTQNRGSHDVVYVLTPKGRELYATIVGGRHVRLTDIV